MLTRIQTGIQAGMKNFNEVHTPTITRYPQKKKYDSLGLLALIMPLNLLTTKDQMTALAIAERVGCHLLQ